MNTDKSTPEPDGGKPGEPATVDEPAEPTVAMGVARDSGDSEPTAMLPAADVSEATVDLSSSPSSSSSPESEPTAVLPAVSPAAESAPGVEESETVEESEPTVTLPAAEITGETVDGPAAEVAEETVVVPSTEVAGEADVVPAAEVAEETVALSAGELAAAVAATSVTEESEPTTMISAGSESTIALPKPRTSPESTPALLTPGVATAAPEPTVALRIPSKPAPQPAPRPAPQPPSEPAPRPASESTVVLPSVPAQRSAPSVTAPSVAAPSVAAPPAEPTIALPSAPVTPAVVPPPGLPLSRRRLLWAIPAVAGAALVGGTIAALAGREEPKAGKAPNLVVSEPAPVPTPTAPRPTTLVMPIPVHTLQDFRKVVPGDPFPADAIALTIDDGPHPVWTPKILRLLEKHHVPALFCMIGNQVLGHEPTARDVVTDGHHVANHTWSHPINVAELSSRKALKEIARAQDKIYSTTGYAPSLFRAPGGAWSKGLSESVSKSGVIPMDWTNDPRDWSRPGVAQITKRLLAAKPGQILLCHDGGGDRSQTLASLKTVIPALQAKGLKFVALM